jgi:mono/diheme cytochrome c family protein
MRWTRWVAMLSTLLALVVAGFVASCATGAKQTEMTTADKIARGRRLVHTSGCVDCHTPGTFYGAPDTTRMLSGSELGWQGPWGVSYPRNLTPDQATGIGSWTEDQIVTAFRTGHRPDGTPLLPPMPWPAYAFLTDEDAYSISAYLKSIPPIDHKAPDRLPPGTKPTGPVLSFPPPPAWDAAGGLPGMPPPAADTTGAAPGH